MGVHILFKSVVQSVLLFGAETWVVTPCMVRVLGGLQYQVTWRLTGQIPRQRMDGKWEYTLVETARAEEGFDPMETYIRQMHTLAAQYITTQSLIYLCEAAERNQGERLGMRWWCYTTFAEAKETLYSVTIWISFLLCIR